MVSERLRQLLATLRYYAVGLFQRADEHHVFLWGGGLATSLVFCIIPFILILFFFAGLLLDAEPLRLQLGLLIDASLPDIRQAELVKSVLFSRGQELALFAGIYGLLGIGGLLFSASGLFSSMRTVLNTVYRVEARKSEPIAKLRDFAMVFFVLCFFLVTITFAPFLEALKDAAIANPFLGFLRLGRIVGHLYGVLSFGVMFGIFFAFYKGVPFGHIEKKAAAVSALSTAILWEIAEQLFGYYINHMPSLARVYGSYALVVALGLWVYYAAVIFVVGAEVGQLYRERQTLRAPGV